MARSQQSIYNQLVANYVATAAASNITINPNAWSMYNIQRLLFWTFAGGAAIFEQILDLFKSTTDATIASAAPQTPAWIQRMMFLFQYDATAPQIVKLNTTTFSPEYSSVDASKRIITNCSVTPGALGTTTVKVAKGGATPIALSSLEVDAASSYIRSLMTPGLTVNVISRGADRLYGQLTVSYTGLYSAVLPVSGGTVVQAIQAYLLGINFNGVVSMDDLLRAIRAVPGVTNVLFNNISVRRDDGSIGDYPLVSGNTWLGTATFQTISGYIQGEDTPGSTLDDTITYIPV